MCLSKPKMPKAPPPAAPPPPKPAATAAKLDPTQALQDRLPGYGGDSSSLLGRLRIPLKY
jgi:hypothetical protein